MKVSYVRKMEYGLQSGNPDFCKGNMRSVGIACRRTTRHRDFPTAEGINEYYLRVECPQCCSLYKISVRPELVEGFQLRSWWFDKLTTNG